MFDGVDMIETILSPGVSAHGETRGYGKGHCGETLVGMGWEGNEFGMEGTQIAGQK